jgi:hypothetical protein
MPESQQVVIHVTQGVIIVVQRVLLVTLLIIIELRQIIQHHIFQRVVPIVIAKMLGNLQLGITMHSISQFIVVHIKENGVIAMNVIRIPLIMQSLIV